MNAWWCNDGARLTRHPLLLPCLIDCPQLDNKGFACKWEGESLVLPAMTARDLDAAELLLEVRSQAQCYIVTPPHEEQARRSCCRQLQYSHAAPSHGVTGCLPC